MTWPDDIGDSGTAPDVTKVDVSVDDKGLLTFALTFANRNTFSGDDWVNILLDTDLVNEGPNGDTGRMGIDMAFLGDAVGWGLLRWKGSEFEFVNRPAGSEAHLGNGVLTFRVNTRDIDGPEVLGFVILTGDRPDETVAETAPDSLLPGAMAVFEINVDQPDQPEAEPTLDGRLTLGRAKAGKTFNVTLVYQRSDSADPATGPLEGKAISCDATVSGKHLRTTLKASQGGVVNCGWPLPRKSRGKIVKGSVGVSFSSQSWAQVKLNFSKKVG